MNKYNVLILDDEQENVELLKIYIKKYCKCIDQIYESNTIEDATELFLAHQPDILLLDIELGNNDTSFSLLKLIPFKKSQIIFITSHKEYALKAINDTNAVAYVTKPITPSDLVRALDSAIDNIVNNNPENKINKEVNDYSNFIAIPSSNKIDIIHPEDILYLEADGRYTVFHLANGTQKMASRNLGEYEKLINKNTFFRIHHSYIVNLNVVVKINKAAGNYCELLNGKSLPIAKRRQDELHRFLKIK